MCLFCHVQSYREWADGMKSTGKRIGRRSKTTHYQKSTHFTLGSDSLEYVRTCANGPCILASVCGATVLLHPQHVIRDSEELC